MPGASEPEDSLGANADLDAIAEKPLEEAALITSLLTRHSLVNHAELPVLAAAYSSRTNQLLVADNRDLRLFSGAQQKRSRPLPAAIKESGCGPIQTIFYNHRGDHFILVHAMSEARICATDLAMEESGTLKTGQTSILAACWLEGRQELVTSGSDGSLKFFSVQSSFTITTKGRVLTSKLVPRMTVRTDWKWMSVICADEPGDRLFVAHEREVLVWSSNLPRTFLEPSLDLPQG